MGALGIVPHPPPGVPVAVRTVEVSMARPGVMLMVGTVLGACLLPGCLRPFGQKWESQEQEKPDPDGASRKRQHYGARVSPAGMTPDGQAKNDSPYSPTPSDQGENAGYFLLEKSGNSKPALIGPSKPVLLMVPSLDESIPAKPDKKPDDPKNFMMESPDLAGQLGPATSAPPTLTEASEPPGPTVQPRSDYPQKEQLLDVLHYFLTDQPGKAIELLKGYDPAKQLILETLLPVLDGLSRQNGLSRRPQDPLTPEEVAGIQSVIDQLSVKLKPRSNLIITKMCFCKSIKAFAMYDPWPDDHTFRASSNAWSLDGDVVQVYVELRNFLCEARDSYHEIHLSSSVKISDPREPAKWIWLKRFDDSKQPPVRSRAQLHDYFCRYYFAVPHLPPGEYTMTIEVVDETFPDKPRKDAKSLPIRVVAAPAGS